MKLINNQDKFLKELSKKYRIELLKKFYKIKQGHPGSVFSMIDIVVSMFHSEFIKINKNKQIEDRIVISKGHATVALYPILANFGVLDKKEWENWGEKESILRVFGNISIPGIHATTGSLGHGLGVGVGMALSFKKSKIKNKVFVIISEGELYEGSTWESLMFASHFNLDNLTIIIDVNNLIILGSTKDSLSLGSIQNKIKSFDLNVEECDGHSHKEINKFLLNEYSNNKPKCLIANTIKGKGISMMENVAHWHYWNDISQNDYENMLEELKND